MARSELLQILLTPREMAYVDREARKDQLTRSAWGRDIIRDAIKTRIAEEAKTSK
jgi:hypothetical protein